MPLRKNILAFEDRNLTTKSFNVISGRATEVFGNRDKAMRWLQAPVPSLGYHTPASLLDTAEGIAEVEDTLGAIEHGIW